MNRADKGDTMAAALHIALSAREDFSEELRAAHVCAALAIAANGRSTSADGWTFVVDRGTLGAVERNVADALALRYAHDPRVVAACGSIGWISESRLIWCVLLALVLVVLLLVLVAMPTQSTPRKMKSTRADALAALAASPEQPARRAPEGRLPAVVYARVDRTRRSGRYRRPFRACACDAEGCMRT